MTARHYFLIITMLIVAALPAAPHALIAAQPGTPVQREAERGSVEGTVMLPEGPAAGATVLIGGLKLGSTTNEQGRFVIENIPPGSYQVVVRLIGYEQTEASPVTIGQGKRERVSIVLRQSAVEMKGVEVTASRRRAADDTRASVVSMTPREAKYLPGAAEDVLRSLRALPGVLSVNDFSSQLVIRGSGPDQNFIAIDGFEVINPYRLYGFISMFNPETVSDISLETGGFGAKYGDRLSAVLDVKNREGQSDQPLHGKINSSLTNANLILEGALPMEGSSWLVSARRTYYDLVLGPFLKKTKIVQGDVALPNFRDVQAKAVFSLDDANKILLTGISSRDGAQLTSGTDRKSPDSVSFLDESFNTLAGVTWQYTPAPGVVAQTRASWYRNAGAGQFDGSFVDPSQNSGDRTRQDTLGLRFLSFGLDYDYAYQKTSFTENISVLTGMHAIEAGGGVDRLLTERTRHFRLDDVFKNLIVARGQAVPQDIVASLSYYRWNLFLQDRMQLLHNLFVQPGIRFDRYDVLNRSYAAPRFAVSYGIDQLTTVRAAVGTYYQSPGMEKQDNRAALDFTNATMRDLKAERADHFIAGIDRMVSSEWQAKFETYYKKFSDVIVPQKLQGMMWRSARTAGDIYSTSGWTAPAQARLDSFTTSPVNAASGRSYGFEFMLQKLTSAPGENFSGWVSYALSYAERERDGRITPFIFDQRHAVNVVGSWHFAERWELGTNFTLRSGRPYVQAIGVKPRIQIITVNGVQSAAIVKDAAGKVVLDVDYEQDAYSGRLSLYHALDLRLTTYPQWFGLRWSVYLDVTNVYNHANQQQINYFIDDQGRLQQRVTNGLPIFPALGFSATF
jgi:hypothetical protein